jgi:SPP1 family predicted phage head-tail adaptor
MLATSKKRNDYQKENTIGRMDRKIYIMEPVVTDGVSNEDKIDSYEVVEELWARVQNETGDTVVEQNQVKHTQPTTFTIRYRDYITIKHRVVNNGKMYQVLSAIEAGEHRKRFTKISGEYLKDYIIT